MRARILLAVVVLVIAGCGGSSGGGSSAKPVNPNAKESSPAGDIPDNQVYVRYSPPGQRFSVKVPEGWSRRASGGAVTFTDKLNTIRLEGASASAASKAKRPQGSSVSTVNRPAGAAVRIAFLADGPPDPVTGKVRRDAVERYIFVRGGRSAVLTLSGPKGADNVDPWRIVTSSLRWSA
jgi:hypothetical protein